jgi:hypothetical protein
MQSRGSRCYRHLHAGLFVLLLAVPTAAFGAPITTFATFTTATSNPLYTFTNNNDGTGTFVSDGLDNVYFFFVGGSIPAADLLMALPSAPVLATLTRTSNTSSAATCSPCTNGNSVTQELGTGSVVFKDDANHVLLSITGSDLFITGVLGGTSGNFNGSSSSSSIAFSSDYIDFSGASQEDRSIALNAITPALSISGDGLLNSFTAQASGNFGVSFAPEPDAKVLLFAGLGLLLLLKWKTLLARL